MTDSIDWQALIQKHLDGLSSEEEAAALSDLIVNSDAVRSEYLQAARLHGALGDETVELDREVIAFPSPEPKRERRLQPIAWSRQLAAAIVTGAFVGLTGIGVVWAMSSPRSEAIAIPIANGDFQSMTGPIATGFPSRFGYWSGNPAEVVQEAEGNQALRFLETGNVMGNPAGGASNCSVFQLVDLTSLRRQWDADRSESQLTLELSAQFRRKAAPHDANLPKLDASIRIYLFQGEPVFLSSNWPDVLRDADAMGQQSIQLNPGDESATISTSCLLNPDVTMALIAVSANTRIGSKSPIELGGYFVDDVQLTAIKQPVLPVRFVK
jgi:hypothetical protein